MDNWGPRNVIGLALAKWAPVEVAVVEALAVTISWQAQNRGDKPATVYLELGIIRPMTGSNLVLVRTLPDNGFYTDMDRPENVLVVVSPVWVIPAGSTKTLSTSIRLDPAAVPKGVLLDVDAFIRYVDNREAEHAKDVGPIAAGGQYTQIGVIKVLEALTGLAALTTFEGRPQPELTAGS